MLKKELVSVLATNAGLPKAKVADIIDYLKVVITAELAKSGEFTLPGVAKFKVSTRAARKGRNPATGEVVDIPAKQVVKVKPIAGLI